jgi:hypothetical protein
MSVIKNNRMRKLTPRHLPRVQPRLSVGSWDNSIKLAGLVLTLATISFSAWQYGRTERWKREEFLITQFNKFKGNEYVRAAQHMLNYTKGHITIGKDTLAFDDDLLRLALDKDAETHNDDEYLVMEIFDTYFDELSVFNRYRVSGLINHEEVLPYFKYHIDIMNDEKSKRKSLSVKKKIRDYINAWQFEGVIQLDSLCGYCIRPAGGAEKRNNTIALQ